MEHWINICMSPTQGMVPAAPCPAWTSPTYCCTIWLPKSFYRTAASIVKLNKQKKYPQISCFSMWFVLHFLLPQVHLTPRFLCDLKQNRRTGIRNWNLGELELEQSRTGAEPNSCTCNAAQPSSPAQQQQQSAEGERDQLHLRNRSCTHKFCPGEAFQHPPNACAGDRSETLGNGSLNLFLMPSRFFCRGSV